MILKNLIVLVVFSLLFSCKSNEANIKFVYLKEVPHDVSLPPQNRDEEDIWDFENHLDSIVVFNKREIKNLINCIKINKYLKDTVYPDFSSVFIIKNEKQIDTIYSTYYFEYFCDSKVNANKLMQMNYEKIFEVNKSNNEFLDNIPKKIKRKYLKFLKKNEIKFE